jgi:hypothetical protein
MGAENRGESWKSLGCRVTHILLPLVLLLRIHGTAAAVLRGFDKLVLVYLPKNIAPGRGNFWCGRGHKTQSSRVTADKFLQQKLKTN